MPLLLYIRTSKRQDISDINPKSKRKPWSVRSRCLRLEKDGISLLTDIQKLCKTIAKLSFSIASKILPYENLTAYNSCRLIALDKVQGLRPIGIGEVLRQIIGKKNLKRLGKKFQLCLG